MAQPIQTRAGFFGRSKKIENDLLWFKEVKHGKYVIRFWRSTNGWISELISDDFLKDLQNETT